MADIWDQFPDAEVPSPPPMMADEFPAPKIGFTAMPPALMPMPNPPAAVAVSDSFDTPLTPSQEKKFLTWKGQYAPDDSGADYDLRGAYAAGAMPDPETGHWPDTFKKPNHPTFSNESQYADVVPGKAGSWRGTGPDATYLPPPDSALPQVDAMPRLAANVFSPGMPAAPTAGDDPWNQFPEAAPEFVNTGLGGPDAAVGIPEPSRLERSMANIGEASNAGSLAGGIRNLFLGHSPFDKGKKGPPILGPSDAEANAALIDEERLRRAAYEEMPGSKNIPDAAAALAGQLVGSMPSPESWIGGPEELALKIGEKILPKSMLTAVKRLFGKGAVQAGINTAVDPAVQELNIAAGTQDKYNPEQTLLQAPLGFAVGTAVHTPGEFGNIREGMARQKGVKAYDADVRKFSEQPAPGSNSQAFLPPPGKMTQLPMTEAEIAAAQKKMKGSPPRPEQKPNTAKDNKEGMPLREKQAAAPGELFGQEGRAPQTRDNIDEQRKADEAFRLAKRQRERIPGQPDTLDTQAAGRPQGLDAQEVHLDQGFPVEIQSRRFVPDEKGGGVEVAMVQRYDPRTGQHDAESIPYEVPVRNLKKKAYPVEPRQGQDFTERAKGPRAPQTPHMPEDVAGVPFNQLDNVVPREPKQTFRATAPDNNTDFPGAGPGRSPLPEQPAGPGPYKTESDAEAWFKREQERRARGEQTRQEREAESAAQDAYKDAKSSNKPHGKEADGNWKIDEFGFVKSEKGGPIKFADQKMAARWIISHGQKDTEQILEIHNHPSGKGYAVKERGRSKPQAKPASAAPQEPAGAPGEPRQLAPPEKAKDTPWPDTEKKPAATPEVPPAPAKPADSRETPAYEPEHTGDLGTIESHYVDSHAKSGKADPVAAKIMEAHDIAAELEHDLPKNKNIKELRDQADSMAQRYAKLIKKGQPATDKLVGEAVGLKIRIERARNLMDKEKIRREKAQSQPQNPNSRKNLKQVPMSFTGFVRKLGGISDPDGDIAKIIDKNRRLRGIITDTGMDPDKVREAAIEAGYIPADDPNSPNKSSVQDVKDLLQKEADGQRQYSAKDARVDRHVEKNAEAQGDSDLQAQQDEHDLRAAAKEHKVDLTDEEVATIIKDYRANDPIDAVTEYLEDQARQGYDGKYDTSQPEDSGIPFGQENQHGADEGSGTQGPDEQNPQADQRPGDRPGAQERPAGESPRPDESAGAAGQQKETGLAGEQPLFTAPEESARTAAARNADKRLKGEGKQKSVDDLGLFDEGRAKDQGDIFGPKSKPGKKPPGTFYSNPFFNPSLMGSLLSSAGKQTMKLIHGEIGNWTREARRTERILKDARDVKGFKNGLKQWGLMNSEVIWGLSKKHPDIKAFKEAHDALSTRPGSGRAIKETFEEAHTREMNQFSNRMANILGDHADDLKFMEGLRDILTTGQPKGTQQTIIARRVASLLKEIKDYATKAGIDMGDIKNYFPRLLDPDKVMADEMGFHAAAKKQYMADGLNSEAADTAARDLYLEYAAPDNLFMTPASRGKDNTKGRSWGPMADKNMKDFLVTDPGQVLFTYIDGMTYRAEWARRFGQDNAVLKDWIRSMGGKVEPYDISLFKDAILASTGRMRSHTGSPGERAMDTLMLFGTILNLKRVMVTSIPEAANVGAMTGNPIDGMGAFVESLASMIGAGGKKEAAHREFAEFVGAIGSIENQMMQLSRYGLDIGTAKSRLRSRKFFIANGLTRLDTKQRIRAIKYGRVFMQDLAEGVLAGGKKSDMAIYGLSDYGISQKEAKPFAEWLINKNKGLPDISTLGDRYEPMTQKYLAALARFSKQAIQSTHAVNKPYMAYNPKARAIFGLTGFYYGLEHNVVQPAARRLMTAIKGRNPATDAQLSVAQRLAITSTTLVPLMLIYGLNKAVFDAREKTTNPTEQKQRSAFTNFMIGMSRPGWTGRLNPLMGLIDDSYYETELPYMLAGPNPARVATDADAIRKYFSNKNSPNTPAVERTAFKGIYDLMLGGLIYKLLPYAPLKGLGAVAGFAAMQAASAPGVQNTVATKAAEYVTGQKYKPPRIARHHR